MNKQYEIEAVKRHHNLFFGNSPVRIVEDEEGNPWWVAQDVCEILGIQWKGTQSLAGLDKDEYGKTGLANATGHLRDTLVISESGLYTLTIRSHKPQAKPFRKWVTQEVLPSIRKTGGYAHPAAEHIAPPAESRLLLQMAEGVAKTMESMGRVMERFDQRLDRLEAGQTTPGKLSGRLPNAACQVGAFVAARCREAGNGTSRKVPLYREYVAWCDEAGEAPYVYGVFFRALYQAVPCRSVEVRLPGGKRANMVRGMEA
ncbi:MAG: BRO family protein [Thermodesulfobacteriota bacterium]